MAKSGLINVSEREAWRAALAKPRPLLVHLNADTTWMIQIPYPEGSDRPAGRSRFNLLIDPWLQGPQSDVASWFSTQWHVVEPSVNTIAELNSVLGELEAGCSHSSTTRSSGTDSVAGVEQTEEEDEVTWFIDAVAVSHEFTDHCHRATLEELPRSIPVIAGDEAAKLIRSWDHFDHVVTAPPFSSASPGWREALADCHPLLPPWLAVGRVVTAGNSLYYHSALLVAFETARGTDGAEAIVYSPHGIEARDLEFLPSSSSSGLRTLALLHGLHDVRIWMTKQLNLGALNGLRAVRASGAGYWVATHDEVKRGGGFVSWLLQRTTYTLKDAVEAEEARLEAEGGQRQDVPGEYRFLELGSGDALVLE